MAYLPIRATNYFTAYLVYRCHGMSHEIITMNFKALVVATVATIAIATPTADGADVAQAKAKRWWWIDWRMFEPID